MKSIFVLCFIVGVLFINESHLKTLPVKSGDVACIDRYLRKSGMISGTKAFENTVESDENCDDKINLANKEFYRQLNKKSSGNKKVDYCAIKTLKENNVTNLIFKEIISFHYDEIKEPKILKELKTIKTRFFSAAEVICNHQDIFAPNINEKFDNLAENNVDINDIYEFNEIKHCVQKQIINNDAIDVRANRVDIKPKNIDQSDLDELDCKEVVDDLYNTMTRDIEEIISPSPVSRYIHTECVVQKAHEIDFLETMFSYVFLIHSNMSKKNKRLVRNRADVMEKSVTRFMLECVDLY